MTDTPPTDDEDAIIVIGTRPASLPGGSIRIPIRLDGTRDAGDHLPVFIRNLLGISTNFDLDENFNDKQQEIIVTAIRHLANDPKFAAHFSALMAKNVEINIEWARDLSDTRGGVAAIWGRNPDGTVSSGAVLTIFIQPNIHGAPITNSTLAAAIMHELIHTFGNAAFDTLLHAFGSDWDEDLVREAFPGYNWSAPPRDSDNPAVITSEPGSGAVSGTGDFDIIAGSDGADNILPGVGGSIIFSGQGSDSFQLIADGSVDTIFDDGGNDVIIFSNVTSSSAITLLRSGDGNDLIVRVGGLTEAIIMCANGVGAIETIRIGGSNYSVTSFSTATNQAPHAEGRIMRFNGDYLGGPIGTLNAIDPENDPVSFRIISVSGDYSDDAWHIDASGAISGSFGHMASQGNAISNLLIGINDGIDESVFSLTVAWDMAVAGGGDNQSRTASVDDWASPYLIQSDLLMA